MTAPTLDSFFSGGGGKSVSWKDKPIGTSVTGIIKTVNPPQQQTDPVDGKPVFKKDGITPKMSVRIDLATSERDPSDPDDDGSRSLFVAGWMQGAIGDALRAAGVQGPPQPGGTLTVRLIAREPNQNNPKLNPTNKFDAHYVPGAAVATGEFFNGNGAAGGALPPLGTPAVAQAGQAAYPAASPIQAPLAPLAPPAPAAEPEPVRPEAISPEAWAVLPLDTKKQLAGIPF